MGTHSGMEPVLTDTTLNHLILYLHTWSTVKLTEPVCKLVRLVWTHWPHPHCRDMASCTCSRDPGSCGCTCFCCSVDLSPAAIDNGAVYTSSWDYEGWWTHGVEGAGKPRKLTVTTVTSEISVKWSRWVCRRIMWNMNRNGETQFQIITRCQHWEHPWRNLVSNTVYLSLPQATPTRVLYLFVYSS